jgi:hypothetical protein
MRVNLFLVLLTMFVFVNNSATLAQSDTSDNDLEKMLDANQSSSKHSEYITATFKGTRIVNGHSVENVGKGVLDFRISHRFGTLNSGSENFWGLDNAITKLGLDYGITNWLMVGIGRSTYQKEFDFFTKIKLTRQKEHKMMSFSVSYVGSVYIQSLPASTFHLDTGQTYFFSNRVCYMNQLIIAHKFSNAFSLQLMPTHVHYNLVDSTKDPNDIFALGIGGRIKLSNRIALTGEYYYNFTPLSEANGLPVHNTLSFGIDIETGGHVFQLVFTNSTSLSERSVIGQTNGDWGNGDIHFGFNISRVFTIVQPKEFKNSRNKIW